LKKKKKATAIMNTKTIIVYALLILVLGGMQPLVLPAAAESEGEAYTPQPGSAERKAILDALREWVKRGHHPEVIFVVKHLKVKNGYAWVHTLPQSKDGSSRYEDLSALLKKDQGLWSVAEVPCGEVDNPDCIGDPGYFDGLKQRFPEMPTDILQH
jgi:hypothetical protein